MQSLVIREGGDRYHWQCNCIDGTKSAIAELSIMEDDDTWYFNRLKSNMEPFVITAIMRTVEAWADRNKIVILCELNPYGKLNYDQLRKFYAAFGFVSTPQEQHMLRYPRNVR